MLESLRHAISLLFDSSSFPARWYCGNWSPLLGWTHIISDLMVASAYLAIPLVIFFFIIRRPDVPFPKVAWLFGGFIIACGTTHLIEATIFWNPVYRLSAVAKVFTAGISWVTVLALIQIMPQALRYPGLEALNRDLQRANEDLEDFARIVSHDLRAPLRGIHRVTEWMDESLPAGDAQSREHLELLRNRAQKMDAMINGILLYSKAGVDEAPRAEVDTRAVVEDVMLSLAPEQRGRLEMTGTFPVLQADGVQVYQVFQNLIENALRYTDGGTGHIIVSAKAGDRMHRFSVQDNGPGVAKEEIERIFRVFHTSEPASSMHSGLGLAIARKVLEKNDGKIWLESPAEGGCRFVFTWPARTALERVRQLAAARA